MGDCVNVWGSFGKCGIIFLIEENVWWAVGIGAVLKVYLLRIKVKNQVQLLVKNDK